MSSWSYNWTKYKVEDKDIPTTPHWAVLVYRDDRFSEAGYDRDDSPSTRTVRVSDYYAFTDKGKWEELITCIYNEQIAKRGTYMYSHDNENVVAFQSGGRAKVEIGVKVTPVVPGGDDGTNPMHRFGHGRGD